jgi:hypothetical protein
LNLLAFQIRNEQCFFNEKYAYYMMKNSQIYKICYDLNPKNCFSKFQYPSIRYAVELVVICYGITILISSFTQDLPSVPFHKELLFQVPINIFNSTILTPILEEILFFGIPISITNHPVVILTMGTLWSVLHLFAPMNAETFSLSFSAFITTLPILFIHFKMWKNGLGWISIIIHCTYNLLVKSLLCSPNFTTCTEFYENSFEFPEFYVYLGIVILSIIIVYFFQRRKEERE